MLSKQKRYVFNSAVWFGCWLVCSLGKETAFKSIRKEQAALQMAFPPSLPLHSLSVWVEDVCTGSISLGPLPGSTKCEPSRDLFRLRTHHFMFKMQMVLHFPMLQINCWAHISSSFILFLFFFFFFVVRGPLTFVASPAAEHRLWMRRLSGHGSRAQPLHGMWDLPRPGHEPVSPASAGGLSTTAPPGKP